MRKGAGMATDEQIDRKCLDLMKWRFRKTAKIILELEAQLAEARGLLDEVKKIESEMECDCWPQDCDGECDKVRIYKILAKRKGVE